MAYITEIYEWEGDTTQGFDQFQWGCRQMKMSTRRRLAFGQVLFEEGDLDDYQAELDAYNDTLNNNKQIISSGLLVFESGPQEGFPVGIVPIAGTQLADAGTEPTYSGDKSLTLYVYRNGTLVATKSIYNERPFRTGVGKSTQGNEWKFVIKGNVDRVKRVCLAPSVDELKVEPQEGEMQ